MEVSELDLFIDRLGVDPEEEKLNLIYERFKEDFILNPFKVKGMQVKVVSKLSNIRGFENYPETFVHLITRKGQSGRVFDKHRANKIHWIKCILLNCDNQDITYFETLENGALRHYYWYKEGDFLVIMEPITPNYLIITSFCIDNERNRKYFSQKEQEYRKGLK